MNIWRPHSNSVWTYTSQMEWYTKKAESYVATNWIGSRKYLNKYNERSVTSSVMRVGLTFVPLHASIRFSGFSWSFKKMSSAPCLFRHKQQTFNYILRCFCFINTRTGWVKLHSKIYIKYCIVMAFISFFTLLLILI